MNYDYQLKVKTGQLKPAQKYFNPHRVKGAGEVREMIHGVLKKRVYMWRKQAYRKGFLVKFFTHKNLELNHIKPKFDEIQKFRKPEEEQGSDSDDTDVGPDEEMDKLAMQSKEIFKRGDIVKVISGELKGLKGKVQSTKADLIVIKPDHKEITFNLEIHQKELAKYFEKGNYIIVTEGKFAGEKGLITKVDNNLITFFSSIN